MSNNSNRYPIDEKRIRTLHIINVNEFKNRVGMKRHGSLVDVKNLRETFEALGNFRVKEYLEYTSEQLKGLFSGALSGNHSNEDFFFCVIMSHGNRVKGVDYITGSDNVDVSLDELIKPIKECASLVDKPKMFFVQACRGEAKFENANFQSLTDATQAIEEYKRNNFVLDNTNNREVTTQSKKFNSDYLIFYSTTRGFVSLRDPINGTPFVRAICKVFTKSIKKASLMDMITDITNEIANNNQQVTELTGSMARTLFFTKVIHILSVCRTNTFNHELY
jgi:caspase 7